MSALDDFGFDLGNELKESGGDVKEAREKNLAFQVRRLTAKHKLRRSGDLIFRQNGSLIQLPTSIFNDDSSDEVTVVSIVYDTLSSILSNLNVSRRDYIEHGATNVSRNATLLENSKIISSTVKPLGKKTFKQPVKIVLENNGTVRDTYVLRIINLYYIVHDFVLFKNEIVDERLKELVDG